MKVHLHHFSKIKSQKESQNRRNQGFSYYFCMMIEGSGSGSIPLTSGFGSGRPKNMWIRWIRIRNTAFKMPRNWVFLLVDGKIRIRTNTYQGTVCLLILEDRKQTGPKDPELLYERYRPTITDQQNLQANYLEFLFPGGVGNPVLGSLRPQN